MTTASCTRLAALITSDDYRLAALEALRDYPLSQACLAAGFVRNLIWDYLHRDLPGFGTPTPLNDLDVIYYDPEEPQHVDKLVHQQALTAKAPGFNWQVKNQAYTHIGNGDRPYYSVTDAMSYWPEKETAVGVRLTCVDTLEFISPFPLDNLFTLTITHNPRRKRDVFDRRVTSKQWLQLWPRLRPQVFE